MQNNPNDDKRYQRDKSDQTHPKSDHAIPDHANPDHGSHDEDVQHPDAETDAESDGVTPVRQTERRDDRASDDGMRPADRREVTGL
jgi:hypothetical protein